MVGHKKLIVIVIMTYIIVNIFTINSYADSRKEEAADIVKGILGGYGNNAENIDEDSLEVINKTKEISDKIYVNVITITLWAIIAAITIRTVLDLAYMRIPILRKKLGGYKHLDGYRDVDGGWHRGGSNANDRTLDYAYGWRQEHLDNLRDRLNNNIDNGIISEEDANYKIREKERELEESVNRIWGADLSLEGEYNKGRNSNRCFVSDGAIKAVLNNNFKDWLFGVVLLEILLIPILMVLIMSGAVSHLVLYIVEILFESGNELIA